MSLPTRSALPFFCALLAPPLFLEAVAAQHQDLPAECDTLLDLATVPADGSLKLKVADSLCLDSHQVETWFLSRGGWTSDLTEDHRYWRLRPPDTPARTTLVLVMPNGEQREAILISQPASS